MKISSRLDRFETFVNSHFTVLFVIIHLLGAILLIAILNSHNIYSEGDLARKPIGSGPIKNWVNKHHVLENKGKSTSGPMRNGE